MSTQNYDGNKLILSWEKLVDGNRFKNVKVFNRCNKAIQQAEGK